MCSENSKSVAWPETVMSMPAGDVRLPLVHVGSEVRNVEFPSAVGALVFEVLDEYLCPLGAGDILIDMSDSCGVFHV